MEDSVDQGITLCNQMNNTIINGKYACFAMVHDNAIINIH